MSVGWIGVSIGGWPLFNWVKTVTQSVSAVGVPSPLVISNPGPAVQQWPLRKRSFEPVVMSFVTSAVGALYRYSLTGPSAFGVPPLATIDAFMRRVAAASVGELALVPINTVSWPPIAIR